MGVDNAWPFLASIEGLEFPEVEPKYAYAKVHLDMPATYLALFRSIQCHKAAADALYKNHLQWLRPRLHAFKTLRGSHGTIDFKNDLYDIKTAIRSDRGSILSATIKMAQIPHPKIPLSEIQEYRNTPAVLGIEDGAFGGRQAKTLDNMARVVSVGEFDFRIEIPKISVLTGGSVHYPSIL